MTEPESLRVTQLMKRWRCDRNVILKLIKAEKLKAFKLGTRMFRVSMAEVLRFEQSGGAVAA